MELTTLQPWPRK